MTTQPLELKYKLALAKMLPDEIKFFGNRPTWMKDFTGKFIEDGARDVRDTEWLQICQWAEEKIPENVKVDYVNMLFSKFDEGQGWDDSSTRLVFFPFITAIVNQRCAAMEAVGVFKDL
jgi:hypothetical protein